MITRRLLLRTVVPVAGLAVVGASVLVVINSSGPGGHASVAPHRAPAVPTTVDMSTVASPPPLPAPPPAVWRVAWASTMAWGYGTAAQATIRELTTVAIGGQAVRVRISNLFGTRPLVLGAGTVAASTGAGATIDTATLLPLAFNGSANVTVPTGAVIYTEPVPIAVHAGETLAVSLFITSPDLITVHPCCAGPLVSYFTPNGAGNATEVASGGMFAYSSTWERLVDAIDVLQAHGNGSIVVLGDSISDGYHSALRWTDVLQQRIDQLPSAQRRAVVNEAITANTLTDPPRSDATTGGGPAGLDRPLCVNLL